MNLLLSGTHLFALGGAMLGITGRIFSKLFLHLESSRRRLHEKDLLVYSAHTHLKQPKMEKPSSTKVVTFRDNLRFTRIFITIAIFSMFLMFPVLAIKHIPFATYGMIDHNFMNMVKWATMKVTYIQGMPIPPQFWDIATGLAGLVCGSRAFK